MIAAVRGSLAAKSGDRILVETESGITYEVAVPLGVLESLPPEGQPIALKTVLVVREDGWSLYGFDADSERLLFQRLLGASGVGPRLALALVSTLGGSRLVRSIKEADLAALCTVPGVGKKTAERIVIELKDRLKDVAMPGEEAAIEAPAEQAVQALTNLGYNAADADRAVRQVLAAEEGAATVDLIRGALHHLTRSK